MLVLKRWIDQRIRIGDDIIITVVEGGPVKLGIDAPRHITVDREEIYQRRQSGELPPRKTLDIYPEVVDP